MTATEPHSQTPTPKPRRRWLHWVAYPVTAFVMLMIGVSIGMTDTGTTTTTAADDGESVIEESRESPAPDPEPEPTPEPDGYTDGRCDEMLDSDKDLNQKGRYTLVATVDAVNDGNIGIEVDVWVEFDQIGAEPLRYAETVEVPVGETETVHFNENITRDEWNRFTDSGWECEIGGDLVATFGEAQP